MRHRIPRREFLGAMTALAAASAFPTNPLLAREVLYPPMDLSHFDTPLAPAPSEIHFGYASITWGGKDRQAIEDIAAVGFRGIQLRSNSIAEFGSPSALRDAAGLYLQVLDNRPKGRVAISDDYKQLGKVLTELGKRTADLGIPLGYHNHMGSLSERPEELDQVMSASDPRYVKLELDIAHYFQGGGDPVKAIEKFSDRLLFLHIKDVERVSKSVYRFVELGHGLVDIPAVFESLGKIGFRGWAVVELDEVPENAHSPKEAAAANKEYLQEKLGLTV